MQVIVYRAEEALVTVEVTSQSYYHKELMKEEYFLLSFSLPKGVKFEGGDYINMTVAHEQSPRRFDLCDLPDVVRDNSTSGWKYTAKFEAGHSYWKRRVFADPTTFNTDTKQYNFANAWSITARPDRVFEKITEQITVVMAELKWPPTSWSYYLQGVADEPRFFEFNGTTIWEALDMMAEAWDVEWWVEYLSDGTGRLHIGKCYLGDEVTFDGNVVNTMTAAASDAEHATRLIPFGSTRNLPPTYRSDVVSGIERRLMLPWTDRPNYIDVRENMEAKDIVEQVVVFKDIFPHQQLTVKDVDTTDRPVEGSDVPFKAYRVTWNEDFQFSESWVLPNVELRIVFESGKLQGMDFAAMFNPDNRDEKSKDGQIIEIVRNENYGIPVPNKDLKPSNGKDDETEPDKFVLYGFDAKQALETLVPQAEQELLARAKQYLEEISVDPAVYTCKMNAVAAKDPYDVGQKVLLQNPVYFDDKGRASRIQAIERKIDNPTVCTYQVGDNPLRSRLKNVEKNISEITYKESTTVNYKAVDEGDVHTEDKYNPYNYLTAPQEVPVLYSLPPWANNAKTTALIYCGAGLLENVSLRKEKSYKAPLHGLAGIPQENIMDIQVCLIGTAGGSHYFHPTIRLEGGEYNAYFQNVDDSKHTFGGTCYYHALVKASGGGKPPQGYGLSLSGDIGVDNLTGGGSYPSGTTVQVSCEVVEDYRFMAWTIDDTIVSTSPSFSYTMPPQDVYMVATSVYTPVKYTLALTKGAGVTAVTGAGAYASGEMVTVAAAVADANVFEAWFRDGERWEVADTFTFEMPADNVTLSAAALPFALAAPNVLNVDASLIPSKNNAWGVGSSTKRFNGLYAVAGDFAGNLKVTGNATVTGSLSAGNAIITGSLSAGSITAPLATSGTKGVLSVTVGGSGKFIVDASISNGVLTLTRGSATVAELVTMLKSAGVSCSSIVGTFGCSCSSAGCSCSAQGCYSNCSDARNAGCCSSYYTCSQCKTYCCNRSPEAQEELLNKFGHIDGFKAAFEAWQAELDAEEERKKATADAEGERKKVSDEEEAEGKEAAAKVAEVAAAECPNKEKDANILFETLRRKIEALEGLSKAQAARIEALERRNNS